MGKLTLSDLIGVLKDKASLSKAILLSKSNAAILQLAVLRATTHEPTTPPNEKQVSILLSYGHSSRITASTCIEALMHRLHNTRNSFVAFKCLIIIHYVIKKGSFILQDQLSVYPSVGGRNYLNLSNFHDDCTTEAWNLSFWVRWYARVLESVLFSSKSLGFFTSSSSNKDDERVSSLLNQDLLRELDVLVTLIEEICKAPELLNVEANKLVYEAMSLVQEDKFSCQNEIMIRVMEVNERVETLSFADSVELVCVLKRFENCKQRVLLLFMNKENSVGDLLWGLVKELKEKVGESKEKSDGRIGRIGRGLGVSESARFGDRAVRRDDSFRYGSDRLDLCRFPVPVLETKRSFQY